MEIINTIIAIFALVMSSVALYFSRKQYLHDAEIKYREELSSVLSLFSKFNTTFYLMKRERNKTGEEINEQEEELFSQAEKLCDLNKDLSNVIKKVLENDKIKYDKSLLTQVKLSKHRTEGLYHWVEQLFDRFKRFNENKLPELKKKTDEIQKKLETMQP